MIILPVSRLPIAKFPRIFRKMINMIIPLFFKILENPRCFSQGDQHDHCFCMVCAVFISFNNHTSRRTNDRIQSSRRDPASRPLINIERRSSSDDHSATARTWLSQSPTATSCQQPHANMLHNM
jgi:hypothetical protein